MAVAKDFSEHLEPFLEWLDAAEKAAQAQETVSVDPERIALQLEDQQNLVEDVLGHYNDQEAIQEIGQDLLRLSEPGEDRENLQHRLQDVAGRYQDLSNHAQSHLADMQDALPLSEQFYNTHDELQSLLQQVEPELRGAEPTGPEAEAQVNVSKAFAYKLFNFIRGFNLIILIFQSDFRSVFVQPEKPSY